MLIKPIDRRPRPPAWMVAGRLLALGLILGVATAEARMYRWVDEDGAVHYTDKLPPSAVDQGHTTLNEEGLQLESVPRAPTEDELKRALEEARARQEEALRVQREKAIDRRIIATYRVTEDVLMAREGRLASIDARIKVVHDGIRRERVRLRDLDAQLIKQQDADPSSRRQLEEQMIRTERSLIEAYGRVIELERQKEDVVAEFDRILQRFSRLRGLPVDADAASVSVSAPHRVDCNTAKVCERGWGQAKAYFRDRFGVPEQHEGIDLLIASQRDDAEDRILTLARVPDPAGDGTCLYLDLQCKNRLTADTTCTHPESLAILSEFSAAVTQESAEDAKGRDDSAAAR